MLSEKYRPKKWKDLKGQPVVQDIREACRVALREHDGPIRWMFTSYGIPGCGKSTAAYMAAQKLTGQKPEMLYAQNTSVQDLFEPAWVHHGLHGKDGRRCFVLNDIEHFSIACKKALLDTSEHAPRHIVLIATTTCPDWSKGVRGLESRFRYFEFEAVAEADIIARLSRIIKKEKRLVVPDGFDLQRYLNGDYGRKPERGNVRDAIDQLESVIARFNRVRRKLRASESE